MEEESEFAPQKATLGMRIGRLGRILWYLSEYLFDKAADLTVHYAAIMRREAELFLGIALTLIGFFNFKNGKNCDGNTADYLSCTRPSTFYYYSWIEITLIVIGVFLLLLWYLKKSGRHSEPENA